MRILIVSQYYFPEFNSVNCLAEELLSLGNEVTVITGKPNYGFNQILPEYKNVNKEIINGVLVYRVNLLPRKNSKFSLIKNYLSFYFSSNRFVSKFKEKYDIVLSFSLSPVISISPAIKYSKKNNVPHLLFCEDLWPESVIATGAIKEKSLFYKVLYKWSKKLYQNCTDIVITSPSFKEYFNDVLNINDKTFEYINQPIIENNFTTIKVYEYDKKHNFVYAGNIGSIQLIDNLIDATKMIDDDDFVLHLIGSGRLLNHALKRIEDEKLNQKVIYHGLLKINEVEQYFPNASALIVSLKNEGFVGKTIPNKAIQYLKYNRPILGVINGDSKKMLTNAGGAIFSSEDPNDIAKKMKFIASLSKEEKEILGNNNKKYYEENFSINKIALKVNNKLKSML